VGVDASGLVTRLESGFNTAHQTRSTSAEPLVRAVEPTSLSACLSSCGTAYTAQGAPFFFGLAAPDTGVLVGQQSELKAL